MRQFSRCVFQSLAEDPIDQLALLLFGGEVTHAARPVTSGTRVVFVASFTPRARAEAAAGARVPDSEAPLFSEF